MKHRHRLTRRQFFRKTATALAATAGAPFIFPGTARGANAPSNRITLAMIGTGNQGFQDMRAFLAEPESLKTSIIGDDAANHMLTRANRAPWVM